MSENGSSDNVCFERYVICKDTQQHECAAAYERCKSSENCVAGSVLLTMVLGIAFFAYKNR
jgi:hypothetical protein